MKIIFCINTIKNFGGMERVLINRANYLVNKFGYEIWIITTENKSILNKDKKTFYILDSRIKLINLDINYDNVNFLECNRIKRFFLLQYKKKKHKYVLENLVKKIQPNILVSFGDASRHINYKIKYNCKKILENHFNKQFYYRGTWYYKIKSLFLGDIEKRLIKKYDEFIVLTKEDKEQWENKKIKVINNPLPFYSEKVSNLENKKIISAGRLEEQKGYDMLIDVWKIVNEKYSDWTLEIYGEGNERKKLEEKIKKLNLEKTLKLKGNTSNIREKFLDSSIYVMSSRYEGFGLVLIEAEHCGLPLVSFKCHCGPSDIISHGENGFLCGINNINEMANYIVKLIEDKELRKKIGKKAREDSYKYLEEKIMKQWQDLYENNK